MILTSHPTAKYAIIKEVTARDDNLLNINWLCEMAGVSRSGYYDWLKSEPKRLEREANDKIAFALILKAYKFRGYDKGARGINMRLLRLSPPVIFNVKKIRRLMNKFGLKCKIRRANPYRRMAKAMQTSRVAPNILNREFRTHGARTTLLTDITYIPRYHGRDGCKYTYLCVIMDAHTKEILSYVGSLSLEVDFVLLAVRQLIEKHGHELKTDTLVHSDQGCHFTSSKFIDLLNDSNLRQSMSRRGNCWDNAPQESFFGHMKQEVRLQPSDCHTIITRKLDDWIDYYNNDRPQWGLVKLTPTEYYRYQTTGEYPLSLPPTNGSKGGLDIGGAAPIPPEFNALVSKEGDIEKDDTS